MPRRHPPAERMHARVDADAVAALGSIPPPARPGHGPEGGGGPGGEGSRARRSGPDGGVAALGRAAEGAGGRRVGFVDCGGPFKPQSSRSGSRHAVNVDLMDFLVHPNAQGSWELAACVRAGLQGLEGPDT